MWKLKEQEIKITGILSWKRVLKIDLESMLQPERSPAGGQLPAVPAGPLGGCSREPRGTGRLFQRGEYCIIISYSILPNVPIHDEKKVLRLSYFFRTYLSSKTFKVLRYLNPFHLCFPIFLTLQVLIWELIFTTITLFKSTFYTEFRSVGFLWHLLHCNTTQCEAF